MGLRRPALALSSCVRRLRGPAGVPGTTPATATFSPVSLSPAILALASVGLEQTSGGTLATADADPVGRWLDQSGNGNHLTQATASKRGTLKLVAGKWRVRLDAVDDGYLSSLSLSGAHSLVLVGNANGNSARALNSGSVNALMSFSRAGIFAFCGAGIASGSPQDTNQHVGVITKPSGGNWKGWLDGVNITDGTTSTNWGTVTLANEGSNPEMANTDIAAVLAFSYELTPANVAALTTWGAAL